jgi:DNA-binding MarR family transcriptional regulator
MVQPEYMKGQFQMEDSNLKEDAIEVRDPKVAALLVNTKAIVALAPFLHGERTLTQAAAQVGMKLPRLTYWIKKFVEAGLLQQTRLQQRAGSAIAYYRSVSSSFYVSYTVLPEEVADKYRRRTKEELEQRLEQALGEVYGSWGGAWGLRIGLHPTGNAAIHQVAGIHEQLNPTAFDALSLWDGLRLDPVNAKKLQQELYNVLERYRQKGGSRTYLVRIAVAATNT